MTITINSLQDFTLQNARSVAWGRSGVVFGDHARAEIARARSQFDALLQNPKLTIYGVTSGYGQQAKTRLSDEQRREHAARLPKAPAASWGDPLPDRATRAIVFARLANFVEGHAAVSPVLADAVAAMLDDPQQPQVPVRGQGGAGEILSLSHLFLPVLETIDLGPKDVLSMINGSPAATGLLVDAALGMRARLDLGARVLTLAAEAFNAPLEHFDPALDGLWNNAADSAALQQIRGLLDGGHGGVRRPYQAPVSFRILPRVLGQAHLAAGVAETVASESLAAVTDNPVILPPDAEHPHGRAISTGGYHNAQAPMVMDQITAACANLAIIAERMSAKLQDPAIALMDIGPDGVDGDNCGYLGCVSMAIAGYAEEARSLATATLLPGSESGGFGANDVASPVFAAWSKQDRAGLLLDHALAAVGPIAVRAFRVSGRPVPEPLRDLAALIEEAVPDTGDADLFGPASARLAGELRERLYAV